jgi:hypothetical protein
VTIKPRSSQVGRRVTAGRRVRSVTGLGLVLIGLMLLGVVLMGFGVKRLEDTRRYHATAEPAKGVVVRVENRVENEWV